MFRPSMMFRVVSSLVLVSFSLLQVRTAVAAYVNPGSFDAQTTEDFNRRGGSDTQTAIRLLSRIHSDHEQQSLEEIQNQYRSRYGAAIRQIQAMISRADSEERAKLERVWSRLYTEWQSFDSLDKDGILKKESDALYSLQVKADRERAGETRKSCNLAGFEAVGGVLCCLTFILIPLGIYFILDAMNYCE